jgi:nucleoside-diphosphate-sugar epimerase
VGAKGVVIITGSAGRIGTSVSARLGKEYQIVGFELLKAIYASNNEELVPVDISSDESVVQAFRHVKAFYGNKISAVIHLAAYYSFSDQHYENYKKITVGGTKRLLEALEDFEVGQFIFSSTMLVHKSCQIGEKINEEAPLFASWAYPMSKIETEAIILEYSKKMPVVILRIAGVYDDKCHSIPISNQIQRIYEKQFVRFFFPGNLDAGASFIHMDDLISAIVQCVSLRKTLPRETILLLGEEKMLSTDQLQRNISKLLTGKEMKTFRIPKIVAWIGAWVQCHIPFMKKPFIKPWMISLADDNYDLDISKAKKVLQLELKHSLEKSLSIMINDLKNDPAAFYKLNGLK